MSALVQRMGAMRGAHWLALFALILVAWGALYAMALPDDLRAASKLYGAEFWRDLCTVTPDAAGFGKLAMMWALMSAAMMAPTAIPAFATYDDLSRTAAGGRFWRLVAGYLVVWLGFAVLAAGAQMGLYRAGLVSAFGDSLSAWLSAGLLVLAGAYQFSPVKEACLSKCRMPLTFFMERWDDGPWRNGLALGLICLGCCWALMLLAFVGGVMNIAFMGLATLLMALEKLPDIGRWLTKPLGAALILSGSALALRAMV